MIARARTNADGVSGVALRMWMTTVMENLRSV
jgi:hypothetical protein